MRANGRWSATPWLRAFAALLLVVATGMLLPTYWVFLASSVAIGALIARGVGVVTMQTGLLLLSPLSFAAIGGWLVSFVAADAPQFPFVALLALAAVVSALLGALLGVVTSRIRGIEFAVVTLGFAAAVDLVLRQGSFAGVSSGTPLMLAAPFNDARWLMMLTWGVLFLAHWFIAWCSNTRVGLSWQLLRVSERAAASVGVNVTASKATAVAIAAAFSGVAGGLFAALYGLLTPQMFSVLNSLVAVATAVLAGASLLSGAVLASALAVFMPELLRRVGLPLDLGNALFAVGAIDVLRRGQGGIAERVRTHWVDRRFAGERVRAELTGGSNEGASSAVHTAETALTQTQEQVPANVQIQPHQQSQPDQAVLQVPGQPVLQIEHLTVQLSGQHILRDVSLTLEQGHVHALLGANGAGKTTLIDAVTGFVPAAQASILLNAKQLAGSSPVQCATAGVRRTFQTSRLAESLTIGQYLTLSGGAGRHLTDAALQAHKHFGLPDLRVPIRLSDAATRKLIEVAGALAARPKVLLLDEPAAGFTQPDRDQLAVKLAQLPGLFGCAVLLVEHDLSLVRAVATQVTVLDQGRVIAAGNAESVFAEPDVQRALLGN